jgi:hypothetical protein
MRFTSKIVMRVAALGVATAAIGLPLTSMTSAHATVAPSLTVNTSISLADGEAITVTGANFPASSAYSLLQCVTPTTGAGSCDLAHATGGLTDTSGGFTTSYTVHSGTIGDGVCGKATSTSTVPSNTQCDLAATTDATAPNPATNAATVNIFFNPILTVTPSTNLKNGAKVKVSGAGFPQDNAGVYIVECSGANQLDCGVGTLASSKTTATGTFPATTLTAVNGSLGSNLNGKPAGSCTSKSTGCIIAATTNLSGVLADEGTNPITLAKIVTVKTATAAKASAKKVPSTKKFTISGTVKAAGKGVKGLKTELEIKSGKKWKKVSKLTTKAGGKFKSGKLKGTKTSVKYEVVTAKQTVGGKVYLASTSKVITVKK